MVKALSSPLNTGSPAQRFAYTFLYIPHDHSIPNAARSLEALLLSLEIMRSDPLGIQNPCKLYLFPFRTELVNGLGWVNPFIQGPIRVSHKHVELITTKPGPFSQVERITTKPGPFSTLTMKFLFHVSMKFLAMIITEHLETVIYQTTFWQVDPFTQDMFIKLQ